MQTSVLSDSGIVCLHILHKVDGVYFMHIYLQLKGYIWEYLLLGVLSVYKKNQILYILPKFGAIEKISLLLLCCVQFVTTAKQL